MVSQVGVPIQSVSDNGNDDDSSPTDCLKLLPQ